MPIDKQQKIAAQQLGQMPSFPGTPPGANPTSGPAFIFPQKPNTPASKFGNTVLFGFSMAVICTNALWGEPVAIVMCTSGLVLTYYKICKEVTVTMAKWILGV